MPEIQYGSRSITFELIRAERKTMEIAVLPDQSVLVKVPQDKRLEEILTRIRKRALWIVKQQAYFASFQNSIHEKEYVSGETFRYLGRQYLLKVIPLDENLEITLPCRECVRLRGRYLYVYTKEKNNVSRVRKLVERWYREHAEKKFNQRIEICLRLVEKYGIERPPIEIRSMKNRWGSFTASGKVLLNPRLIEWPAYCIDYVILHELCHLKYAAHNKQFYQLLHTVLPDWQEIKRRLEG